MNSPWRVVESKRRVVARAAHLRTRRQLPFGMWLALARAAPVAGLNDDTQGLMGECEQLDRTVGD